MHLSLMDLFYLLSLIFFFQPLAQHSLSLVSDAINLLDSLIVFL